MCSFFLFFCVYFRSPSLSSPQSGCYTMQTFSPLVASRSPLFFLLSIVFNFAPVIGRWNDVGFANLNTIYSLLCLKQLDDGQYTTANSKFSISASRARVSRSFPVLLLGSSVYRGLSKVYRNSTNRRTTALPPPYDLIVPATTAATSSPAPPLASNPKDFNNRNCDSAFAFAIEYRISGRKVTIVYNANQPLGG
jgi:hypothetical protein